MSFRRIKNNLLFVLIAGIFKFMQALPLKWARATGDFLGRLFFFLVPYERNKALRQLAVAFPEKSRGERFEIAQNAMGSLATGVAEFMRFSDMKPLDLDRWIEQAEGFENFERARAQGKGIVAVTLHLANWELLATWVAARIPTAVVARQLYDERLDARLIEIREKMGFKVFARNTSVKPILRWLQEGKCLGVLADQDTSIDSVFVDLFGKKAKTPSGPAWLAAVTGSELITAYAGRQADGRYRLHFDKPLQVPVGAQRGSAALTSVVQAYTQRLETAIRRYPDQYAWIHDRWKTRPPGEIEESKEAPKAS